MIGLRAITVRQPYGWAITAGLKDVENRASGTPHRGPLAITAALPWSDDGRRDPVVLDALYERAPRTTLHRGWGHGVVLAVADLVDVHRAQGDALIDGRPVCCESPWATLMYGDRTHHLVLRDVVALVEPIRVRGALSVWTLPEPIAEAVDAEVDLAGRFW